ncbi:MAG: hypothetical protein FJ358_03080 [Thaumarchaeota archaeon]|nr:hypothetical protein [Nitrososphaerota archaeon]
MTRRYIAVGAVLAIAAIPFMGGPIQTLQKVAEHLYQDAIQWPEHLFLAGIIVAAYGVWKVFSR